MKQMKRLYQISMILLMTWLLTYHSFAEELQYDNGFLLSVFFKVQALRDEAITEIRKIDMEIKKNDQAIQESQRIINIASQRTDENAKKAEAIAREALIKAQEAKRRNEDIKREWQLIKMRADRSYAVIENLFAQNLGTNRQIKGFITNYTGNVSIIKANGDKVSPENGFLEPGDKVWTLNGTAEIQMLDGRADVRLGPYSEFVMKKDTPQEQIAELLKGKIFAAVDKVDEYEKMIKEKIEQYKKDLQTIKELKKEDIDNLKKYIDEEIRKKSIHVITPVAVFGVRGTKFACEIKDNNTTEVTVLEGIVDVTIPEKDKTLSVDAGNKATISLDGGIKIEKIEQIERWWER